MPSTYTVNLGIEKPATGEQSGTWGDTTNTNFDILDQAINGAVRITLTSAGTSGSPNQLQITNGAASDGRNKWIEIYSASDLGGSAYLQLDPNDAEKILFIRNSLAGSQSILLFQGTYDAARDLEVPAGVDMVVKFDGGGASAATVTDVYTKLRVTELTTPTLTATTADINGGTLDNSVIGGTTAAAITGTTIVANTSLNIAGDGATVTGIKDEDDMSSNSPTKLATQQSIKAYVDSQVGTVDTWAEVLANGATSGSTNPEIDSGQALKTNTINETTAGSGVTIDSVLLKDDVVNATDIEVSSISANDGTAAATIANSTGNFTITNLISGSVDINGGAIDGTNIGANSAGTGAFTTITGSGDMAIDTDTLFVDVSADRVGINEDEPDEALVVKAAAYSGGINGGIAIQAGDHTSFHWKSALKIASTSGGVPYTVIEATDGGTSGSTFDAVNIWSTEVVINENSADRDFRVESNGNANMLFVDATNDRVGVGTNTPDRKFTVSGTDTIVANFENTTATGNGRIAVTTGSNTAYFTQFGQSHATTPDITQLSVPSETRFVNSGVTVATMKSSGNTGFGTTNPQYRVHTEGSSAVQLRLYRTNSTEGVGVGIDFAQKNDAAEEVAIAQMFGVLVDNTDGTEDGKITFHIRQDGSITQKFSIDSAGAFVSDGGAVINEDSQDSDFRVESNSNAHMLFVDASTDRIGVNTSAPSYTLDVNGPIQIQGVIRRAGSVVFDSNGALTEIGPGGSGSVSFHSNSNMTTTDQMAIFSASEVVFNEQSYDQDFRVESNNRSNALFIDAGEDVVKLGWSNSTVPSYVGVGSVMVTDNIYGYQGGDTANSLYNISVDDNYVYYLHNGYYGGSGWTQRNAGFAPTMYRQGSGSHQFEVANDAGSDDTGISWRPLLKFSESGGFVWNENSYNTDFRVESDGNTNMIFVDASANAVGIGKQPDSAGNYPLDVNGAIRFGDGNVLAGLALPNIVTTSRSVGTGVQWFKIYSETTSPSPRTVYFRVTASGDNTSWSGTFCVTLAGYNFSHSITLMDYQYYNTSKLLEIKTVNPGSTTTTEVWLNLDSITTSVGTLTVSSSSSALVSSLSAGSEPADTTGTAMLDGATWPTSSARSSMVVSNPIMFGGDQAKATFWRDSFARSSSIFHNNDGMNIVTNDSGDNMDFNTAGGNIDFTLGDNREVCINEGSASVDFRVESNNNTDMLFVDGSNDTVSIGTNSAPTDIGVSAPTLRVDDGIHVASHYSSSFGNPNGRVFTLNTGSNGAATWLKLEGSTYQGYRSTWFRCHNTSGNWNVTACNVVTEGTAPTFTLANNGTANPTITLGFNTSYSGGFVKVDMHTGYFRIS